LKVKCRIGEQSYLLQLRILRFGFFQNGDVRVGVFPLAEKVLIRVLRFGGVACDYVGTSELKSRQCCGHGVHDKAAMIEQFLELGSCGVSVAFQQIGFGNFITSEIIASLEYSVAVLGTKVILVMGHEHCGAVEATIAHKTVPGQISALYPHIQPAVDKAGTVPDAVAKANALIQAALLRQSSTVISARVATGKLLVLPAFYNISSGVVSLLE
jgi:Carbonic anhydrase